MPRSTTRALGPTQLVERVQLKGFLSENTSLSAQNILSVLDDSLRSYIVPFTKSLRDEWFIGKTDIQRTTDANGQVSIPDTIGSTLRTVAWNNGGILVPLSRIEPENSFVYQPSGGSLPAGYMLRGYSLEVLPRCPGITLHLTGMLRPASLVPEEDAARVTNIAGAVLTLASIPLAWQSSAPTAVDIISADSPFTTVVSNASVSSLSVIGSTLTLTTNPGISGSVWVSNVGTSPFPNIPIELHPLLEQDVITTLYTGLGDKRLAGAVDKQKKMEGDLRSTVAPRVTGSSRPIVNPSAPGMRRIGIWGR